MWHDRVTVVSSDMREFNPPEKADILVSELLGSFGDNELSPECLDGAQKFLKSKNREFKRLAECSYIWQNNNFFFFFLQKEEYPFHANIPRMLVPCKHLNCLTK